MDLVELIPGLPGVFLVVPLIGSPVRRDGSEAREGVGEMPLVVRALGFGILLVVELAYVCSAQSNETLTNEHVLQMIEAKVPNHLILKTIDTAVSVKFDTSPAGVIALKRAGADDQLIDAMLESARRGQGRDRIGATVHEAEKSQLLNAKDPQTILRSFRTIFVDARKASFFDSASLKAALGRKSGFQALGVTLVDDPSVADMVLEVSYVFAWDYPFALRHQNTSMVVLSGKGYGPFSGPAGADSVASEFVKLLKPHRSGLPKESSTPAPAPAPATLPPRGTETRSQSAVASTTLATKLKVNSADGLTYVWIPPGAFTMGCSPQDSECESDESAVRQVRITKGFWMGQTEVTQDAYQRLNGKNPSRVMSPDRPVESVTWDEAQSYCRSAGLRLPTEAEWEYAARGGTAENRYGPIDRIAWHSANATGPVRQREPNAYGLYDMLGNVWEWVGDWYQENAYQNSVTDDPKGPASGQNRVMRGGSFDFAPKFLRASTRNWNEPGSRNDFIGFRCAGDRL